MPIDCQIEECGILAIGRCRSCGLAFCMSHRAKNQYGYSIDDLCTSCARAARDGEAADQRRAGTSIRAALDRLDASSNDKVRVVWMGLHYEKKLFGASREIRSVHREATGLLLGDIPWTVSIPRNGWDDSYNPTLQRFTTVLLDGSGNLDNRLVRVKRSAEGYEGSA
jgi:hypothetical protein